MPETLKPSRTQAPDNLLEELMSFLELYFFSPGEMILSPANDPHIFYYVLEGTVEVSYTNQNDTRITVALIGAGEFFGEIGFFDGETRVRDIRAVGDVEVGIFTTDTMNRIREINSSLYIDFIMFLTQRICHKFRQITEEREPISAYADLLSSKRSSIYSVSKPLPTSLLHSSPWYFVNTKMEKFRTELFDLSHQLQRNEALGTPDLQVEEHCQTVLGNLNDSLIEFKEIMAGTGYEDVMWGYVFKEVFPYFMRSHFAQRAYFKPKGYAGDFLMMEHIYANKPKGEGKLGEIIDSFCLGRAGSLAIRGRRKLLKEEIARLCSEHAAQGKNTRIMNLACGPNRELFDFPQNCEHSEKVDALCVDVDSEALQYTNQFVNIFPHRASVRLLSENVIKWSLGRTSQQFGKFDVIYSAGLCDYLETKLFRALITQCYNHLNPGGTIILGNFSAYPDSIFLDKLLKWELIYRNVKELKELFAPTPFKENVLIVSEKENVNLFAIATKD